LCIKRLDLSAEEFEKIMQLPPKTFHDYNTSYNYIMLFKYPIKILSHFNILPKITYYKYFKCGE